MIIQAHHFTLGWSDFCPGSNETSPETYRFQYAIMIVVSGRAIISPINPSNVPHTDSERSSRAGFMPIAFPITFGTTIISFMTCTMQNTATADAKIIQKLPPVSAAFSSARNAVGMSAKVCRYGTRFIMPINMPRPIAIGKSIIVKKTQNCTAIMNETSDCPLT